jgi:hypothetical protein
VRTGSEEWDFKKHGVGIRFLSASTGEVIDVCEGVGNEEDWENFDCWRLQSYIESLSLEWVEFGGAKYTVDQVEELCGALLAAGYLRSIPRGVASLPRVFGLVSRTGTAQRSFPPAVHSHAARASTGRARFTRRADCIPLPERYK